MNFLESASNTLSPLNLLPFISSGAALWFLLALVFIVYIIISCVLVYHWRKYGMKSRLIKLAQIAYFAISLPLFGLAALFITLIK